MALLGGTRIILLGGTGVGLSRVEWYRDDSFEWYWGGSLMWYRDGSFGWYWGGVLTGKIVPGWFFRVVLLGIDI